MQKQEYAHQTLTSEEVFAVCLEVIRVVDSESKGYKEGTPEKGRSEVYTAKMSRIAFPDGHCQGDATR